MLLKPLFVHLCVVLWVLFSDLSILGLLPRDKGAILGVNTREFFSGRISMKTEFRSQMRERLLFFTTNMATVTSRAKAITSFID